MELLERQGIMQKAFKDSTHSVWDYAEHIWVHVMPSSVNDPSVCKGSDDQEQCL